MKGRPIAVASLIVALAMPLAAEVSAESLSPSESQQIHSIVEAHLEALSEDDATRAFEFADEKTREALGSPEIFMEVIKDAYSPIYHNRSAVLDKPEIVDGQPIVAATVTSADNRVWIALFRMEQDQDSSWKIGGCALIETSKIAV